MLVRIGDHKKEYFFLHKYYVAIIDTKEVGINLCYEK